MNARTTACATTLAGTARVDGAGKGSRAVINVEMVFTETAAWKNVPAEAPITTRFAIKSLAYVAVQVVGMVSLVCSVIFRGNYTEFGIIVLVFEGL